MNRENAKRALLTVVTFILLFLWHYEIMVSTQLGNGVIFSISIEYLIIDLLLVSIPFTLVILLTKRYIISLLITSVLITILSIINYYTLLYHGSVILAGELASFRTALNVVGDYNLSFNGIIKLLIFLLLLALILIYGVYKLLIKREIYVKRRISGAGVIITVIVCYLIFFSSFTLFPTNLCGWSWISGVSEKGYEIVLMNSFYIVQNKYIKPDTYDVSRIVSEKGDSISNSLMPDVILVLNESLCDIDYYSNVPESGKLFDELKSDRDIISGYSVVSQIGGGTNNSEYELLTSNSMSLINASAPFTFIDMTGANSIVSYLEKLGYTTVGMHCEKPTNYNRKTAYEDIGFDHVSLGKEAFNHHSFYGHREWLDLDNYQDLIETYDKIDGETPRFIYLLTMQNHGGYEQNDSDLDNIVTGDDYGSINSEVNEYLTSIQMSIDAFKSLKAYYENQERPAVIMMVGDHAPAFITELPLDEPTSNIEQSIAQRMVPFFVYANFEIDRSAFDDFSSMVDLVPRLLKSCDMPLSSYYKTILKISSLIPVRTKEGYYCDNNGEYATIDENSLYYEMMQNYYFMEYNNLSQGSDYVADLFEIQ